MDVVTIRELSHSPGRLIERLKRGPLLITRSGRPMAVLHPIDEEALADYVLANAPEFVASMREAEDEIARGERGRSLDDILDELATEEPRT